ncbi:hypothetical protein LTS18_007788 [Coniosporium uncinatum]|uniref:Uncharacterized protein n=1 Tax=Coniosporium uncinatum TaxID=93489 RepID=A0ACC3D246_9PEZI|nr:hypothetical protein LTS18_007788 [Coniosporium uncinatum]
MVKPLSFKGDKKSGKKRKRVEGKEKDGDDDHDSTDLTTTTTQNEATEDDDSWVSAEAPSDISGPVVLVLPTETPSCLSCDAIGKVFTIQIENIVEKDPTTAEPHDVRQVWVANRVAGTETLSLKGHHGRYLSCDKVGVLSATKEAVGPEEQWSCIPVPDNKDAFALQTQREKFLSISGNSAGSADADVRGDSDTIAFNESLRIRMQARFKPRLKKDKADRAREKISRKELEEMVGRKLEDDQVRMLKKARRDGDFHEKMLDVKVKGKHDKFA